MPGTRGGSRAVGVIARMCTATQRWLLLLLLLLLPATLVCPTAGVVIKRIIKQAVPKRWIECSRKGKECPRPPASLSACPHNPLILPRLRPHRCPEVLRDSYRVVGGVHCPAARLLLLPLAIIGRHRGRRVLVRRVPARAVPIGLVTYAPAINGCTAMLMGAL